MLFFVARVGFCMWHLSRRLNLNWYWVVVHHHFGYSWMGVIGETNCPIARWWMGMTMLMNVVMNVPLMWSVDMRWGELWWLAGADRSVAIDACGGYFMVWCRLRQFRNWIGSLMHALKKKIATAHSSFRSDSRFEILVGSWHSLPPCHTIKYLIEESSQESKLQGVSLGLLRRRVRFVQNKRSLWDWRTDRAAEHDLFSLLCWSLKRIRVWSASQ